MANLKYKKEEKTEKEKKAVISIPVVFLMNKKTLSVRSFLIFQPRY